MLDLILRSQNSECTSVRKVKATFPSLYYLAFFYNLICYFAKYLLDVVKSLFGVLHKLLQF